MGNQQWVVTNYFFTKTEKFLLGGTEKLCGPAMDFCVRIISLWWKGKDLA